MGDDFSDIDEQSCEELGLHGYCFFACIALLELHPNAELWRLTGSSEYAHVFLKVNGKPLDIKGFRDVEQMMQDCGDEKLIAERADFGKAKRYFGDGFSEPDERDYVTQKFRRCIKDNAKRYA